MKPDFKISAGGMPVRFVRDNDSELQVYVPDAITGDAFDPDVEATHATLKLPICPCSAYVIAEPDERSQQDSERLGQKASWRILSLSNSSEADTGLGVHKPLVIEQFWGSTEARFKQRYSTLLQTLADQVNASLDTQPNLQAVVSMNTSWEPTSTMQNIVRTVWLGTLDNIEQWAAEAPETEEQIGWRKAIKPDGSPVDSTAGESVDGPVMLAQRVANIIDNELRQQGVPTGDWSYRQWLNIFAASDQE
ncbi:MULTISPECIES: hypothetical protein [Halomonadaceae]|uniref:hypothetical protein n=1 Tax=Halomonadaceae TaxID=28256 RepID=UPI003CE96FB7